MLKIRHLLKLPTHFLRKPVIFSKSLSTHPQFYFSEKKPPKGFEHFKRASKNKEKISEKSENIDKNDEKLSEKPEKASEEHVETQEIKPKKHEKPLENQEKHEKTEEKKDEKPEKDDGKQEKPNQKIFGYSTENLSEAKKQFELFRKALDNFNKRFKLGTREYLTAFAFLTAVFALFFYWLDPFNTITYDVF